MCHMRLVIDNGLKSLFFTAYSRYVADIQATEKSADIFVHVSSKELLYNPSVPPN